MQCPLTMHTRQKHSGCVSGWVSKKERFLSFFKDWSKENISPHNKLVFEFVASSPQSTA